MSITPHRDAAEQSVAEARRRMTTKPVHEPWQAIARRMDVDATEAVLLGYGDLADCDYPPARCCSVVSRVLASALASFVLTVCGGRQDLARRLLDASLADLRTVALERIAAVEAEGISATVTRSEPRGHA